MENKEFGKWKLLVHDDDEIQELTEGEKPDLIQFSDGDEEPKPTSTPKKETLEKLTDDDLIVLSGPSNKNAAYLPSEKPIKISEYETLIPSFFSEKIEPPVKNPLYPEFNDGDLTMTFFMINDWLTIVEKCIRNKPTMETFDKYTKALRSIMLSMLSASSDFRRRFYTVMDCNVTMDYRRTLKTAGEAIHTMRQFLSEEELKLMDVKAEGYKKLHERTMSEPFDKFIIDRINGFGFK